MPDLQDPVRPAPIQARVDWYAIERGAVRQKKHGELERYWVPVGVFSARDLERVIELAAEYHLAAFGMKYLLLRAVKLPLSS